MTKNAIKDLLDLTLHPVRVRMITLLAGSEGMTPQQMAEQLSDIPQATLYRHINRLVKGGVLTVVEERPVRGTLEKVYALNTAVERQLVTEEEGVKAFQQLSKEDHMRYFSTFIFSLLDDFSQYLHHSPEHLDMAADGVGYHKLALFLSDEEFGAFGAALNQALAPYLGLKPSPERKKRLFTTVMMPSETPAKGPETDG